MTEQEDLYGSKRAITMAKSLAEPWRQAPNHPHGTTMIRSALIIGGSGQIGVALARNLLSQW